MKLLNGTKVLLLYAKFFNYDQIVKNKLEELGAYVDLFDARAEVSTFEKAIKKIYKGNYQRKQIDFHIKIQQNLSEKKYDYIFSNAFLPSATVKGYKTAFPDAKMILYLDDSVANLRGVEKTFNLYDRVITFDRADADKYGIEFRPLFYADSFVNNRAFDEIIENDICFIGTLHSDRLKVIQEIERLCHEQNKRVFVYGFLQSKIMYYLYYILKKEFRNKKKDYFKFISMQSEKVAETIAKSFAVLDIQHPRQTGLTMRTIETIGAGKKMITTNSDIRNYDLYNPNNIYIIDRSSPTIDENFFLAPYENLSNEIQYKYSIEGWLDYIFR